MTTDSMLLPSKFAPLSQLGVDAVTNWARANPDMAREAATLLSQDPRAGIQRFFRLTSDQVAGLASVPDVALRAIVSPLVERWRSGRFPQVELQIEYETVPATPAPFGRPGGLVRVGSGDGTIDVVESPDGSFQPAPGVYYQQQAPQAPQAPGSGRQKCKKVIAKIAEIIDILL